MVLFPCNCFLISKKFLGDYYFFFSLQSMGYCVGVSVIKRLLIRLRRTTWHQGLVQQCNFNKRIQEDWIWTNTKLKWKMVILGGEERTVIWTKRSSKDQLLSPSHLCIEQQEQAACLSSQRNELHDLLDPRQSLWLYLTYILCHQHAHCWERQQMGRHPDTARET